MQSNRYSSVISVSSPTSSPTFIEPIVGDEYTDFEPIVRDEDTDFEEVPYEDTDFAASESSGEQWGIPENQQGLDPDRFRYESEDRRYDEVVALDKKGKTLAS